MIKFFRHIRKSLLMENKTSKYLKYAIGEIILVVFGILIALWLNQKTNYNNERQGEISVLKEIRNNLDSDLIEITKDINTMDSTDVACFFVLDYLKVYNAPNKIFGVKSLILRTSPHFNPNKSGYNLLESKGVEIILNDSLRKGISDHYESMYPYYNKYEQERIDYKIQTMNPMFTKWFKWLSNTESAYLGEFEINEDDYKKLNANHEFRNFVSNIQGENNLVRNRAYRVKNSIIALSSLLDQELKSRQ
jgi:hypothetical protein